MGGGGKRESSDEYEADSDGDLRLLKAYLPNIYRPCNHPAPDDQDGNTCAAISTLLHTFASSFCDADIHGLPLRSATAVLVGESKSGIAVRWFGEYGCALLEAPKLCGYSGDEPNEVTLALIAVDEHQFKVHSSPPNQREFSSTPSSLRILPVGNIPASLLRHFKAEFEKLLLEAQKRKGDKRSAASNKQGHQKTPVYFRCHAGCSGEVHPID
jgi:hypothetical protein